MNFKNGFTIGAQISLIFNVLFSLGCFIGFLFDKNFQMFLISLLIFTIIIWSVYFICILFSETICVTESSISAKRFNKVIWEVQKEEIEKMEFKTGNVFDVILGDPKAEAVALYTKEDLPCLQKRFYKLIYISFFCNKKHIETIKEMGYEILVKPRTNKKN